MTCRQKRGKEHSRLQSKAQTFLQKLSPQHDLHSEGSQDGGRTTVQQRGQNHHSRTRVSRSIRMSSAMATKVPSDYKGRDESDATDAWAVPQLFWG